MDERDLADRNYWELRQRLRQLRRDFVERARARARMRKLPEAGSASLRFLGFDPLDAMQVYLEEEGCPQTVLEIIDALEADGATIDPSKPQLATKKRGIHNIRISIERNLPSQNIICLPGRKPITYEEAKEYRGPVALVRWHAEDGTLRPEYQAAELAR